LLYLRAKIAKRVKAPTILTRYIPIIGKQKKHLKIQVLFNQKDAD